MPLSYDKRTMIIRQEATPGTSEIGNMVNADFNLNFMNIQMAKEIEEHAIKVANGGHDHNRSVMGARKGTLSAELALQFSGTSATPPNWTKALRSAGILATATTDVVWSPDKSLDLAPVSILIQDEYLSGATPLALGSEFKGCMANAKISIDTAGGYAKLLLEYQGCFLGVNNIPNNDILVLTNPDSVQPDAALSATYSFGGNSKRIEKFELDFANEIDVLKDWADPTGYLHALIKTRKPTIAFDTLASLTTEDNDTTAWIAGTELVLDLDLTNFGIDAGAAQIMSQADAERSGLVSYDYACNLNRVAGGYPWTLTQK